LALAERLNDMLAGLPRDWRQARLELILEEPDEVDRAALILAPATPGRSGSTFTLYVHAGTERLAPTQELVRRVLRRLDEEGIRARVKLVGHEAPTPGGAGVEPAKRGPGLARAWDDLLRRLPPDWSDLYAELELDSTDFVERGALLLAPVNPARCGGAATLCFRCARTTGYGVAPEMARRCLARLDEEGTTGRVRLLRVLSGTHLAATQGPVWLVGGRSV
jgi:hypothetical protein